MKIIKKIIVLLLIICLFPLNIHAQENFDISNYDVKMIVHEDGSIDISEKIDLVYSTHVHGFYRNLPIKYNMDFGNGNKTYYFPISDIHVNNDPYEIESNSEGVQIKIGDPDKYITGFKSYDINYKVQTRELDLNVDLLYWNIVGSFDCKIDHISFEIVLPKDFDASSLEFYGAETKYVIENNVIKGETLGRLSNYEQLTMYLELNEDYFNFIDIKDYTTIGLIISIILLLVFIGLYVTYSKGKTITPIVSFEAPKGLGSAGVGYVIDGEANTNDVLSMIIDFANRGYLTIYESEDDIILTKQTDLNSDQPQYEIVFFNKLFDNRTQVSCNELKNEYFGDQILVIKELISNYFTIKENKVFNGTSLFIQILFTIFAGLPGGLLSMLTTYSNTGYWNACILPLFLVWIFTSIGMIFWIIISRQRYGYSKSTFITLVLFALLFNGIGIASSLFFLRNHIIALILNLIFVCCMIYMIYTGSKRTKQGYMWLNEILGLKDFIIQCEQDRLEMLVHDDPKYFYHILPYAYVLGISDTWSKKFEKINITKPDWYSSYDHRPFNTIYWNTRFARTMTHLGSAASSITPPKSSSGGFSSSGGGFSGGGFGGGSGGSW